MAPIREECIPGIPLPVHIQCVLHLVKSGRKQFQGGCLAEGGGGWRQAETKMIDLICAIIQHP
jgi:hypothetical protein